jgi:hypothetical protein
VRADLARSTQRYRTNIAALHDASFGLLVRVVTQGS